MRRLLSPLCGLALAAVACSNPAETGNGGRALVSWRLDANGYAYDSADGDHHLCLMSFAGALDSFPLVPFDLTDSVLVRRDDAVAMVLQWLPGLRVTGTPTGDSVTVVLSGPFSDTLRGVRTRDDMGGNAAYGGTWTCSPRFPLATDPRLVAAGYDTAQVIPGWWALGPYPPSPD
jgi:hypothetical protein